MPLNRKHSPIYATGNVEQVGGETTRNRNCNCTEKRREPESQQDEKEKKSGKRSANEPDPDNQSRSNCDKLGTLVPLLSLSHRRNAGDLGSHTSPRSS